MLSKQPLWLFRALHAYLILAILTTLFFTVLEQELGLKTSLCHDLEGRLDETTTNLEERSSKLLSYEEKLKVGFTYKYHFSSLQ